MPSADRDDEQEEPREAPAEGPGEAGEEAPAGEPASPWADRTARAWQLWEAGDNARLRPLVAELARAPAEETAAREAARELGRRLRPDPVAIALWVVSLVVFGVITYYFVLR